MIYPINGICESMIILACDSFIDSELDVEIIFFCPFATWNISHILIVLPLCAFAAPYIIAENIIRQIPAVIIELREYVSISIPFPSP